MRIKTIPLFKMACDTLEDKLLKHSNLEDLTPFPHLVLWPLSCSHVQCTPASWKPPFLLSWVWRKGGYTAKPWSKVEFLSFSSAAMRKSSPALQRPASCFIILIFVLSSKEVKVIPFWVQRSRCARSTCICPGQISQLCWFPGRKGSAIQGHLSKWREGLDGSWSRFSLLHSAGSQNHALIIHLCLTENTTCPKDCRAHFTFWPQITEAPLSSLNRYYFIACFFISSGFLRV